MAGGQACSAQARRTASHGQREHSSGRRRYAGRRPGRSRGRAAVLAAVVVGAWRGGFNLITWAPNLMWSMIPSKKLTTAMNDRNNTCGRTGSAVEWGACAAVSRVWGGCAAAPVRRNGNTPSRSFTPRGGAAPQVLRCSGVARAPTLWPYVVQWMWRQWRLRKRSHPGSAIPARVSARFCGGGCMRAGAPCEVGSPTHPS